MDENQSSEVVDTGGENDKAHLHSKVDLETEKTSILALFSDYIGAGKPITPFITFFREEERVVQVTQRALDPEDNEDYFRALVEMMYIRPAIEADTSVLSYLEP